jgi:hypothetical protein
MQFFLQGWTGYLLLLTVLLLTMALGYLLRDSLHRLIDRLGRAGQRWLRLLARACSRGAAALQLRNREVMLALQTEISRRQLEGEFHRVAGAVEQDMTRFQHLERTISEHITLLAEDFERSTQVPPAPPGWIAAVDAIAKLQAENNPEAVSRILADIHSSVQDQQREVMREYRWAVNARHKILADLRPLWRRVSGQVAAVGRDSRDLLGRAHRIDTLMAAFRELCANRADVRVESFLARWLLALLLSAALGVLAVLNSALLAAPLSNLLAGSGAQLPALAGLSAAAYTLAVMAVALLVSESAQVTRLLPMVGGLPRHIRILLTGAATLLLLMLAVGESALLMGAAVALPSALANWSLAAVGLILPLLLALLSPALESLLATSRPVLASAVVALLTLAALLLRTLGRLWLELCRLCHPLFDLFIALPDVLVRLVRQRRGGGEVAAPASPAANVTAVDFEKARKAE